MDIQTAINQCLADLSLAKATELAYSTGLKTFLKFLNAKNVTASDDVGKLTMDDFIYFLPWLDKQYEKGTARVYGSATRALLDYLVIGKHFEVSYFDSVRLKKATVRSHRRHEDKLPRFPEKTDVPKILEAVYNQQEESPRKERNIALLEFLASSGCRVSEATALNVKDIDLHEHTTVVTGKGRKERRVFFSPVAAEAIQAYWTARESTMATDPAFGRHDKGAGRKRVKRMTPTTARNIVKDIAVLAGIDANKFSPHYFRHAFAIRVLSETGNLALAQDLLGHKDPKSTRVYAKIHSEDLRKAHQQIFK